MADRPRNFSTAEHLLGGTIAGMSSALLFHPLDTIKVRMQSHQGAIKATSFGSYGTIKKLVQQTHPDTPLSLTEISLSAAGANGLTSLLTAPAEMIKVHRQVETKGKQRMQGGVLSCARQIVLCHGLKGLYDGWVPTLCRDAFGSAVYFTVYELTKRVQAQSLYGPNGKLDDLKSWNHFVSGGTAGAVAWGTIYPFDFLKTQLQANAKLHGSQISAIAALRNTLASGGYRGMYRGLAPTLLRAVPNHGFMLMVVERVLLWLSNHDNGVSS